MGRVNVLMVVSFSIHAVIAAVVAARRALDGPPAQAVRSRSEWRLEFSAEPKHGRWVGTVGVLMVVVGLLRLLQAEPSVFLLVGVFFLLIARWWKHNPIVMVHFDHVDIQTSLLARRRVVRLSDVHELSVEGMTKAFFVLKNGRTVALPLKLLDPSQRWRLLQSLQELQARPRPEISSHE